MFKASVFRVSISLLVSIGLGLAAPVDLVKTKQGTLESGSAAGSAVRTFKGIPFAAPPIGTLRWQPPQPGKPWEGIRKADSFGPRCMQAPIYSDMVFRDAGPSEDCLYLNVWTPATKANAKLPVMVWIYGGGFQAGAASEPRQDGEALAKKGVVVVSMNYRLGVFGFFSHPELTKESPHHASGNYGLQDQAAALAWVHENIYAFGGDPGKVTIFGESAGSMSVSSHLASPLSKGLFRSAIGESGAIFSLTRPMMPLAKSEQSGAEFAKSIGADSLQALRAKAGPELLQAAAADRSFRFWQNVDGYFFPRDPAAIYAEGQQAHVPLLAGWNTDEQSAAGFFAKESPSKEHYKAKVRQLFGEHADEILKLYPDTSDEEMMDSARDLAGDQFIAYSTWKWLDVQARTGSTSVYGYHFEQVHPVPEREKTRGAYHSADIEYVFQNLDSDKLNWTSDDRLVTDLMSTYWSNFAKSGNPNGKGLPDWKRYRQSDGFQIMHLGAPVGSTNKGSEYSAVAVSRPDTIRARYELLDKIAHERAVDESVAPTDGR